MKPTLLIVAVWLTLSYVTGAALWTNWKADFPWSREVSIWGEKQACRDRHSERAVIIGFSIVPFGWFASPIVTSFYQDGFDWSWIKENPCQYQGKPKSVAVKDAGFKVASPAEQESFAFQLPSKTPKPGDCLIVAKKVGNVSELKFIKCPKGVTP